MTPNRHLCSLATAAFAALMLSLPAHADLIVAQPNWDSTYQIASHEPLGQSFTAASSELLGFEFYFNPINPGWANLPITLDIRQGAGTGGGVLASFTFSLSDGFSGLAGSTLSLGVTAGQQYTATLETGSPYFGAGLSTSDVYSGGQGFLYGAGSDSDFVFQATFADAIVPGVPDAASTFAMLSFALLGLGVIRRRLAK